MEVIAKSGLRFELVSEEPYQKKDGTMTKLRVWQSNCKRCGAQFKVSTPSGAEQASDSSSFGFIHCPEHRLTKEEVTERMVQAKRDRAFPGG